jgi:mannonate dehydratase
MEKTWRWFGENDDITLADLRQIGVQGIVTALHAIPNGEVWPLAEIVRLRKVIEKAGLRWSVVESLPVSEGIKYGGDDCKQLIDNYKISLANLGKSGVNTVCYNFMPVIDWVRTDLRYPLPDGTFTLFFDRARFAYFDIYLLQRDHAEADYSESILNQAYALSKSISESEKEELIENIIVKTQGFVNGNIKESDRNPITIFKRLLDKYKGVGKEELRAHFQYFLEQVVPVAEEYDVRLCVHPDDPPFPVLGLPRIVTGDEDIAWFLNVVDNPHNGLTFCAGSLSAGSHNDVPALARKFASRTHFVHLRSTDVLPDGNFVEASHLGGRGNLLEVIKIFSPYPQLPMRVDHAPLMLADVGRRFNPGYSFLGRMKALGEVAGMMHAVSQGVC